MNSGKRIVKSFLLFGLMTLLACSSKNYKSMGWRDQPVVPDGDIHEWGEMLRYYDKDSKLFYETANDADNFYLAACSHDALTQQKIMQKGLEFGFGPFENEAYTTRVRFPYMNRPMPGKGEKGQPQRSQNEMRPSEKERTSDGKSSETSPRPEMKKPMPQQIFVQGFFDEIADSILSVDNPYGIEASVTMKDSTLYLEAKLPFKTFLKETLEAADTLHPYQFQIILSAIDRARGDDQGGKPAGRPSGPPPGGMGGPGGGGMPPQGGGGPGGPPGGNMRQSTQRSETDSNTDKNEIQFIMRFSLE